MTFAKAATQAQQTVTVTASNAYGSASVTFQMSCVMQVLKPADFDLIWITDKTGQSDLALNPPYPPGAFTWHIDINESALPEPVNALWWRPDAHVAGTGPGTGYHPCVRLSPQPAGLPTGVKRWIMAALHAGYGRAHDLGLAERRGIPAGRPGRRSQLHLVGVAREPEPADPDGVQRADGVRPDPEGRADRRAGDRRRPEARRDPLRHDQPSHPGCRHQDRARPFECRQGLVRHNRHPAGPARPRDGILRRQQGDQHLPGRGHLRRLGARDHHGGRRPIPCYSTRGLGDIGTEIGAFEGAVSGDPAPTESRSFKIGTATTAASTTKRYTPVDADKNKT